MSKQKKMFQNVCIKDIGPELNIFFSFSISDTKCQEKMAQRDRQLN